VTVERTSIEGLLVVRSETFTDERGFFRQTHVVSELEEALGREVSFVQGNHSRSRPGVIRGFHAEPWDKLVYVARGRVFAAIADVRPESATFGEVATFDLGDEPGERVRLFVADGLANAYAVVGEGEADYLYDVSREWTPGRRQARRRVGRSRSLGEMARDRADHLHRRRRQPDPAGEVPG
jgi:dTDP-4-dehydrorhamnose 3,5-epimerase